MGNLRIITYKAKFDNSYGSNATYSYYGVEDIENGMVLNPKVLYRDIQIIDDLNIFVKVVESPSIKSTWHFQRLDRTKKFHKKGILNFLPDVAASLKVLSDDIILIKKMNRFVLYSLSRSEEITIGLKNISDFSYDEDGNLVAFVEMTVPEDPFKRYTASNYIYGKEDPLNKEAVSNYIYGKIDKDGNYVGVLIGIRGEVYSLSNELYQRDGKFSDRLFMKHLEETDAKIHDEEERLGDLYFGHMKTLI